MDAFAPYVGTTPRQVIRFINIYRLIKGTLSPVLRREIDLEHGSKAIGLTLIPQLAIVSGTPWTAKRFFNMVATRDPQMVLGELTGQWREQVSFLGKDAHIVEATLLAFSVRLSERQPATLIKLRDMRLLAGIVQR